MGFGYTVNLYLVGYIIVAIFILWEYVILVHIRSICKSSQQQNEKKWLQQKVLFWSIHFMGGMRTSLWWMVCERSIHQLIWIILCKWFFCEHFNKDFIRRSGNDKPDEWNNNKIRLYDVHIESWKHRNNIDLRSMMSFIP